MPLTKGITKKNFQEKKSHKKPAKIQGCQFFSQKTDLIDL